MIYENTDRDINYRNGMGNWLKNYSLTEKGKDWDYCVGLSYRSRVRETHIGKRNWDKLYNELYNLDNSVYGFVVDELDDIGIGIHHHLIIGSELDFDLFSKTVESNWKNKGMYDVRRYERRSGWEMCQYMTKHLNKTNRNVLSVFDSL